MNHYTPRSSDEYIKFKPTKRQLDLLEELGYGDCSSWTRHQCQIQISYCLEHKNNNSYDPTDNPFECYLNND